MGKWKKNLRNENVPLSGIVFQKKVIFFAAKLGHDQSKKRPGWLGKLKTRNGIVQPVISGGTAYVPENNCEQYRTGIMTNLLKDYCEDNIFEADEANGPGIIKNLKFYYYRYKVVTKIIDV